MLFRREDLVDCMSICNLSCRALDLALLLKVEKALGDGVAHLLITRTVLQNGVKVVRLEQRNLSESAEITAKVIH